MNSFTLLEPVVLWGGNYCSLVGVLQELHVWPVVVILSCFNAVALIKASVGQDCIVVLDQDLNPPLLATLRGLAKLGLVDGYTTSGVCDIALQLGLTNLIGTKMLCRSVPG